MALLVSDNGELQSLRYLVNSNHNIPNNLILKLYTSNTVPAEADVPSQSAYYEPYDSTGLVGYGTAPSTGYPAVVNNRWDQDYSNSYGILLNGSEWNVRTIVTPIATPTASGIIGEYTITVSSPLNIAVGHYVSDGVGGVGNNATVAAINGNTIVLTQPNNSTFTNEAMEFGRGTSTASYPEQVFTFTSAANNCYGYYLSRANNMPYELNGVLHAADVAAAAGVAKTSTSGTIGQDFVTLFPFSYEPTGSGSSGEFSITVSSAAGIAPRQRVIGTGIADHTRVVGLNGTTVYLDTALTGAVSGVTTFYKNITEDVCVGMAVTHSNAVGETNAIPEGTTVIGVNEKTGVIYLSSELENNIQAATGNTITFNFSEVTANSHGLVPGDVIYIAAGTANTTTASSTYTIFETPDANTFRTTPALAGVGSATLYNSIFFAERFTNGPYNIQNNGDQIKVTLNISLD